MWYVHAYMRDQLYFESVNAEDEENDQEGGEEAEPLPVVDVHWREVHALMLEQLEAVVGGP